jgi:hypothetical protein
MAGDCLQPDSGHGGLAGDAFTAILSAPLSFRVGVLWPGREIERVV